LPSKLTIGHIDIRVFAHATEDPDRVLNAVRNTLPPRVIETVTFKKTGLTGHYGNSIVLFEVRVKETDAVQAIVERLSSGLSILDKETLSSEISQHLDKVNLYIRLDKQSAYANKLRLKSTDPIHFRIHFKKHGQEEIVDACKKIGLLP
jgi:RNA binding exosome subunit